MGSLNDLSIETTVLITVTFITALLCLIALTKRRWWRSLHGMTLGWLTIGVLGALLRSVLVYWHVIRPRGAPDLTEWISVQCILILPVCFLTMTWQVFRPQLLPWLIRHHLMPDYQPPREREDSSTERQSSR